ncbi:MAG: hypothetical protein EOM20_07140 [Spartobacteria bacterium]|nr:hypothetical protein [Spartobacteria bacterium]
MKINYNGKNLELEKYQFTDLIEPVWHGRKEPGEHVPTTIQRIELTFKTRVVTVRPLQVDDRFQMGEIPVAIVHDENLDCLHPYNWQLSYRDGTRCYAEVRERPGENIHTKNGDKPEQQTTVNFNDSSITFRSGIREPLTHNQMSVIGAYHASMHKHGALKGTHCELYFRDVAGDCEIDSDTLFQVFKSRSNAKDALFKQVKGRRGYWVLRPDVDFLE